MTNNSIALCISGQIRTSTRALNEVAIEADLMGADVFISVWSERGSKTFEGAVGPRNIRRIIGVRAAQLLPDNWVGRMPQIFPDFSRFFPEKQSVLAEELEIVFPFASIEIEDDGPEYDLNASDGNSLRMLYKIWRANQMKCKAELLRGQQYNRVVRVRPDIVLDGRAIRNLPNNPREILVQDNNGNRPDYINDIFWIANSSVDDKLCALYHDCCAKRHFGWSGIHKELARTANAENLERRAVSIVKSGVGVFGGKDEHLSSSVRDKLLKAIVAKRLDQSKAGGEKYCSLVSKLVADGANWPENGPAPKVNKTTIEMLTDIESTNRNSGQFALIYLMNLAILDPSLNVSDKIELTFLLFEDLIHRDARAFIDVKIGDIVNIFDDDPVALLDSLCDPSMVGKPLQSDIAVSLATKWSQMLKLGNRATQAISRSDIIRKLVTTRFFSVSLHRRLTEIGRHDKAYELAEIMLRLSPNVWKAYELKYASARALGNDTNALDILNSAEDTLGMTLTVLELRGSLLSSLGRFEEARFDFEKSLSLPGCNRERVSKLLEKMATRL